MPRYEVIPSVRWFHKPTGRTASVYGSCPWFDGTAEADWERQVTGFTVRDNRRNTVGIGRKPWETREEAEAWVAAEHARLASLGCSVTV